VRGPLGRQGFAATLVVLMVCLAGAMVLGREDATGALAAPGAPAPVSATRAPTPGGRSDQRPGVTPTAVMAAAARSVPAVVSQVPPTPEVTVPPAPTSAERAAPLGTTRLVDAYPGGGALLEQVFYSPALGQDISYWVFLPPGYAESGGRYPTLYMLHGLDAGSQQWPALGLTSVADELIDAGSIAPLLIVLPFASNSYYVDEPDGGPRWADHIREHLVADVAARYRALDRAASRAIGGLSMGGDAALRFALTSPDVFGVVGGHSPSIRRAYDDAPRGVFRDESAFNQANPLWLARNRPIPSELKIWLDVGDGDPWWWSVEALHEILVARDVEHQFTYFVGEHEDDYWSAHVGDYLRFYAAALDRS
jgi:enterochelin esterase-like enzyme